jgi:hypothetical protein
MVRSCAIEDFSNDRIIRHRDFGLVALIAARG